MHSEIRPISDTDVTAMRDYAESLLDKLTGSISKLDDSQIRYHLRACVDKARIHGVTLNLSEPGSRLGQTMWLANQRSGALGYL